MSVKDQLYKVLISTFPFFINNNITGEYNYSIHDIIYKDKIDNLFYGRELKYKKVRRYDPSRGDKDDALKKVIDDPLYQNYIKLIVEIN